MGEGDLSSSHRPTPARRALAGALFVAVALAGIWNTSAPTFESRFTSIQSDIGDPLLSAYLLEHELRALTVSGYVGAFWSPPFFFPARNVLAYSEHMGGILPVYAMLRTWRSPLVAYQLVVLVMLVLCYASMLVLLADLEVGAPLAALGAFLFAFGMPRLLQVGHLHLLPAFYGPLVLLALRRLLSAPGRGSLAACLLLLYLQLLSGIYLGWFLLLGLAILLPWWLFYDRQAGRRLVAFVRRRPLYTAVALLASLGLTYVSFRPFLVASEQFGYRSWDQLLMFLPALKMWFMVPLGSPYAHLLPSFPLGHNLASERTLFPGFALLGLGLLAAVHLLGRRRLRPGSETPPQAAAADRPFLLACGSAALVLVLLSLAWPRLALAGWRIHRLYPPVSLWWLVFKLVPGGGAFRAASRVWTVVYLFAIPFVMGGAQSAIRRGLLGHLDRRGCEGDQARRARLAAWASGLLATLLLLFGVAEQHVKGMPAGAKQPFLAEVARIRAQIRPGCRAVYATLDPSRPFFVSQLAAMWAGLEANVAVVNGYSSNFPPRYPNPTRTMSPAVLREWYGGDLCVVSSR